MNTHNPLELLCHPLNEFDVTDWNSISEAFSSASTCAFSQTWREHTEADFQPTHVWTGWRDNALWIYAEMDDIDIFNPATEPNQEAYRLGDVIEYFLRPLPEEVYYELHVAPNNQQLQLRWSDAHAVYQQRGLSHYFVSGMMQSYTKIEAERNRWCVLSAIPASITASQTIKNSDIWAFSFCRYDYTQGRRKPVLSSSTPYREQPDFHDQRHWGHLTFVDK